jgi:hypothetical protein
MSVRCTYHDIWALRFDTDNELDWSERLLNLGTIQLHIYRFDGFWLSPVGMSVECSCDARDLGYR